MYLEHEVFFLPREVSPLPAPPPPSVSQPPTSLIMLLLSRELCTGLVSIFLDNPGWGEGWAAVGM